MEQQSSWTSGVYIIMATQKNLSPTWTFLKFFPVCWRTFFLAVIRAYIKQAGVYIFLFDSPYGGKNTAK